MALGHGNGWVEHSDGWWFEMGDGSTLMNVDQYDHYLERLAMDQYLDIS